MQKLFWTTAATVIMLCGVLNAADPIRKSMSLNQLVANSDIIVSGKIKEVIKLIDSGPNGPGEIVVASLIPQTYEVGLIEVKRMIYGPQKVKRVKIYLRPYRPGNQYKVGDSGTWFLVNYHDTIARETLESKFPLPEFWQRHLLYLKELFHGVFEAEHPSRFWPDDPQWHKRKKVPVQKLSDEQKKKRRQ